MAENAILYVIILIYIAIPSLYRLPINTFPCLPLLAQFGPSLSLVMGTCALVGMFTRRHFLAGKIVGSAAWIVRLSGNAIALVSHFDTKTGLTRKIGRGSRM